MKTFFKVIWTIYKTIGLTFFAVFCIGLGDQVNKLGPKGFLEDVKNKWDGGLENATKVHAKEKEKQYVIKDIHTINTIGF